MINLAKVFIAAEDGTGPALTSAARNLRGVADASELVAGALKYLTGILSFGFAAKIVKDAIEAQARVKDLATEAGMTVEQISRFEEIARTSGEGLDGIAAAMGKLSRSMVEARDPTSAQAAALRAINLTWKDLQGLSPDEQLIRIAKAQAQFGPGLEKNAAMMAIFSKSGGRFQVTLNEIAEAQSLVSSTTAKQAEEADQLADEVTKLNHTLGLFGRGLVSVVVPSLNQVIAGFNEGRREGGLFEGVVRGITAAFEAINGGGPEAALKRINDQIKESRMAMDILRDRPWWTTFVDEGPLRESAAQMAELLKRKEILEREISKLAIAEQDRRALGGGRKPNVGFDPAAAAAVSAQAKAFEDLRNRILGAAEGLDSNFASSMVTLNTALVTGRIGLEEYAELYSRLIKQQPAIKKALGEEEKIHESVNRAIEEGAQARAKLLDAIRDEIAQQAEANDTYGLTRTQIAALTVARLEDRLAILQQSGAMEDELETLAEEIRLRRRLLEELRRGDVSEQLRAQMQLQGQVWDEAASRGANFFVDLATNGRKAFKNLREDLKAFGQELLAIFMKRWILQMGANLTGNAALNTMAGQVGQGTLAGSALNWLGTGTGAVSSAFAGGSEFLSAATGNFMGPAMPGSAAGMGQSVYAFMTNPATIAVLAAVAIAVVLQARRGGPKEGGSFFGGYDAQGNFTGDLTVPGSDNGRFYTPNGGDSIAREVGQTVAGSFFDILARLGGTTGGMQFGIGYDKDPRGSADSRVTTLVRGADGRVLYSNTSTAGRDDEDFERVMSLETRRAILAGLQGSDLPEAIANILNGVAVSTATSEQIDRVFALADAMRTLLDTLSPLSVEDLVAEAGRSALSAWRAQGDQLRELAANTDLSVESLGRLAEATRQYRTAAAQLILQFEAARRSVAGGIEDTIREMRFGTLDRQGQYDMLRGEADTLMSQVGTMEDAQQIAEAMNRIRQLSSQAFGMLSDEERRRMFPEYEAGLREAQRQADERLVSLRNQVRDEANEQLRQQREATTEMTKAAAGMDKAALMFQEAVRQFTGAEIPVTLHIEKSDYEVQPG